METIGISQIWRLLRWLPTFILRKLFDKQKLSELVYIDVRPRHNAVSVNTTESGDFTIYFQIINLTPFDIELDRAEIDFWCGGVKLNKQFIKKTLFSSGQVGEFSVDGKLSGTDADSIARNYPDAQATLSLCCYFNCDLHDFHIEHLNLEGVNVRYMNVEQRKARLENSIKTAS
ncbi:hypothetical protein OE749_07205 [Aestuariibacter sp. AA17]|uniref:Uncharacterized protein n=1 Tax=Fluctibacter corallii TaxID=2984329 RepID=A0ABT3A831_9ALTE|nr:hypothetical protein [Aestuariibacter sp. AA17]MCV2884476.1 hypothetical protein [Aestuariibacter sp. AA17]